MTVYCDEGWFVCKCGGERLGSLGEYDDLYKCGDCGRIYTAGELDVMEEQARREWEEERRWEALNDR